MKEFIDKLIERLEELRKRNSEIEGQDSQSRSKAYANAISIINQLAEEYKVSEMPTGSECKSNADRIRSMTNEELAEFFDSGLRFVCSDFHCEECFNGLNCDVCYLEWLQSEAE